jgi:hypothetical protein
LYKNQFLQQNTVDTAAAAAVKPGPVPTDRTAPTLPEERRRPEALAAEAPEVAPEVSIPLRTEAAAEPPQEEAVPGRAVEAALDKPVASVRIWFLLVQNIFRYPGVLYIFWCPCTGKVSLFLYVSRTIIITAYFSNKFFFHCQKYCKHCNDLETGQSNF